MNILFLSAWYPNRTDSMAGLFVRKHAEAVSFYANVFVLYVQPDSTVRKMEKEIIHYQRLTEITYYIPSSRQTFLSKFIKQTSYLSAYFSGIKTLKELEFKPDIIHVNILTRTGIIGYIFSKLLNIPYVITEHWTRYTVENNSFDGFLRKRITKYIVKKAQGIYPVSKNLQNSMERFSLNNDHYLVINNTVDNIFIKSQEIAKHNKIRIVHISCFDDKAKNLSGILRVVKKLSQRRNDFELIIIGTGVDFEKISQYAQILELTDKVVYFQGELQPDAVAVWLNNCDFTVLFSNFENSPVVISESLVCGKPVISTQVGGISELIDDKNGILIPKGDEKALEEKLNFMLDHFEEYDAKSIQKSAIEKFSSETIGKKLVSEYQRIIQKSNDK